MTYTIDNEKDIITMSFSSKNKEDKAAFGELFLSGQESVELNINITKETYVIVKNYTLLVAIGAADRWEFSISFRDELYNNTEYQVAINGISQSYMIYRDFLSDMSLINKDGIKLVLQYNPEVTGLKYNYQDTVTATLGGAYPIVRRNGSQKYRTFTIGALIAYDEMAKDFLGKEVMKKITGIENSSLDEYSKRAYKEHILREMVFDFLHSGSALLFRSGQEGNMIVRLTNVSLTSNKQLDRNIYSFSATATEIMECTDENWIKLRGGSYGDID